MQPWWPLEELQVLVLQFSVLQAEAWFEPAVTVWVVSEAPDRSSALHSTPAAPDGNCVVMWDSTEPQVVFSPGPSSFCHEA